MTKDAFGLDTEDTQAMIERDYGDEPETPDETDPAADSETTPEQTETTESDPAAPAATPEETSPDAEASAPPAEGEPPGVEVTDLPRAFLNKYGSLEDAESAFNELRRTERQRATELDQVRADNQRLEEYLRVAAAEIKRIQEAPQAAPKQVSQADVEREAAALGIDPETYLAAQKIAEERIAAELAPIREREQAQTQAQQSYAQQQAEYQRDLEATRIAATSWLEHSGVKEDPEFTDASWRDMVAVFGELELDERQVGNYDLAREIAADASLRATLRAMPDLVESDEGLAIARRLASGQSTDTQPAIQQRRAPRPRAHVESGPAGRAPEAGTGETDPDSWEAVLEEAKRDRGRSVLGV